MSCLTRSRLPCCTLSATLSKYGCLQPGRRPTGIDIVATRNDHGKYSEGTRWGKGKGEFRGHTKLVDPGQFMILAASVHRYIYI